MSKIKDKKITSFIPRKVLYRLAAALAGFLAISLVLLIAPLGWFDYLEYKSLDFRFRARGQIPSTGQVVILSIDEASFENLGVAWPWPRNLWAQAITNLNNLGAKVIGFDLISSEPDKDPNNDIALSMSALSSGNVVFASKFEYEGSGDTVGIYKEPIEQIRACGEIGFVNLPSDKDSFVRRIDLIRKPKKTSQKPLFHFDLKILLEYLGLDEAAIKFDPGRGYIPKPKLYIGDRGIPLASDTSGTALINYTGPKESLPYISFYRVIRNQVRPEEVKGKIILVGVTVTDLHDVFPTPFLTTTGGQKLTPGVEVHGNIIDMILRNDFLWAPPLNIIRIFTLIVGVIVCGVIAVLAPLHGALLLLFMVLSYIVLSLYCFSNMGLVLTMVFPITTIVAAYFAIIVVRWATEMRDKRRMRGMWERYMDKSVVNELIESEMEIKLGGEKREATVLFSDIRGFTSISEQMSPEDLIDHLNEYLAAMTDIVIKHNGLLNKYVGDEIVSVFGPPRFNTDHSLDACKAALDMMATLKKLQEKWTAEGKPIFRIGVGINTGPMVVGNVGSNLRMEYTMIGDNVNLGSRLQSLNKEYPTETCIIISENTYKAVGDKIIARPIGEVPVRGKAAPQKIFELVGLKEEFKEDKEEKNISEVA